MLPRCTALICRLQIGQGLTSLKSGKWAFIKPFGWLHFNAKGLCELFKLEIGHCSRVEQIQLMWSNPVIIRTIQCKGHSYFRYSLKKCTESGILLRCKGMKSIDPNFGSLQIITMRRSFSKLNDMILSIYVQPRKLIIKFTVNYIQIVQLVLQERGFTRGAFQQTKMSVQLIEISIIFFHFRIQGVNPVYESKLFTGSPIQLQFTLAASNNFV
ncbi:hypothetical protein D3C76_872740 [compost metagenome]